MTVQDDKELKLHSKAEETVRFGWNQYDRLISTSSCQRVFKQGCPWQQMKLLLMMTPLPNAALGVKVGTIHGWPKQYPSVHRWHDNGQKI